VISQGSVLGVVIVSSLKPNHFTKERVALLKGILNGLGTLLEKLKLEEEQKRTEERIQETARLTAIGELAAGVAHEINNPLTSVLGYSELVLRDNLPEKHRRDIQTIYDEAERAAKIVQNLLFFARRSGTEMQHLDLNSIVERALEMKSYDFKVNNIRVVTQLSPELRKTMVDEHQLIQVMLNILNNAEQAIRRAQETGLMEISTASVDNNIEIIIRDDGPGITSEHLSRIFEPFFTTKEVGQGIGLGLSVSYGLIQRHGGDIWVESTENEGATFHISLPVVLPEAIALAKLRQPALINKSTKHLLVVDDEPHIRDLLRKYLERERYTVDMAEDGHEAWRKLQIIDYDCVLLDLKMPGMSGRRLYELIQESGENMANKVVFITGDTVGSATQDFLSQFGNPVIAKPFRLQELLSAVYRVWEGAVVHHAGSDVPTVA
jgi:two-component system NtrC family sensor kinase